MSRRTSLAPCHAVFLECFFRLKFPEQKGRALALLFLDLSTPTVVSARNRPDRYQ